MQRALDPNVPSPLPSQKDLDVDETYNIVFIERRFSMIFFVQSINHSLNHLVSYPLIYSNIPWHFSYFGLNAFKNIFSSFWNIFSFPPNVAFLY